MKKKGFTLIELIVVIAIIGVLAAIIVPTMLGYVKKSKITSANTSASEVVKSMNAILSDGTSGDEFRNLTSGDYGFKTNVGTALESISDDENTSISQYIGEYSDTLASQNFAVYVQDGVVVAAATKSGRYFGTSPAVFTNKTYDSLMNPDTMEQALKLAKEKAGITD